VQELQKYTFLAVATRGTKKYPSLALTPGNTQHILPEFWPQFLHQISFSSCGSRTYKNVLP